VSDSVEPPYFVEALEHMEVTTGDAVCLKCQLAGTPEIKVSWFKADGKVRSSPTCKLEYSKGVACLKLSKAGKSDVGEYTCKAENCIGSTSSTCRLSVQGEHLFACKLNLATFVYRCLKLILYFSQTLDLN
jgi:titin